MSTAIPYLDEVWNVTTGCGDDMVSPGCTHCYARRMFGRHLWKCPECTDFADPGHVVDPNSNRISTCPACHGTGAQDFTPTFHADRLEQPLRWRNPRRIGVSFMGDLFHEAIPENDIFRAFDIMEQRQAKTIGEGWGQLTWLLLTKRPDRMERVVRAWLKMFEWEGIESRVWPHVWLGVTVCNQEEWGLNVPTLKATPAAHRWVSYEPALGPLVTNGGTVWPDLGGIDWVVLGPETGPGKRPFDPQWATDVKAQCDAANVPYFDKRESHKHWREIPEAAP